jgi:hypothetical protein
MSVSIGPPAWGHARLGTVIDLKAAEALGLAVPSWLLATPMR